MVSYNPASGLVMYVSLVIISLAIASIANGLKLHVRDKNDSVRMLTIMVWIVFGLFSAIILFVTTASVSKMAEPEGYIGVLFALTVTTGFFFATIFNYVNEKN